jgi:murein DD-endopeptidase MepM/ murein hydrolase activator NlpD
VGASVTAGQSIGELGHSGLSDGPHLHFELGTRARPFSPCAAPQNFDRVHNPARLRYVAVSATLAPPRWCRVSSDVANVRSAPNGAIVRTLTMGASVTVASVQGTWYSVRFRIDGRDWGGDASPAWMSTQVLRCTQ